MVETMGSQTLELKWANHKSNMTSELRELYLSDTLLDVTIACGEYSLRAHKAVLSASSNFFRKLFIDNPCKHPILIMTDVDFEDLKTIVEFMYQGEVHISREKLSQFLKTADRLMVKGLSSIENINLIPSEHFETDVYPHYSSYTRSKNDMEPQLQNTNKTDVQNNPDNLTDSVDDRKNKEIPIIKLEDDGSHSVGESGAYWESECFDQTLPPSIVPDYSLRSSSSQQQLASANPHHSPSVSTSHQLSASLTTHPLSTHPSVSHELVIPSALDKAVDSSSSHQPGVPLSGEQFKCSDNQTDSGTLTQVQEESTGKDTNPANLYLSPDQSAITVSSSAKAAFEAIESLSAHSSSQGRKTDSEVSSNSLASVSTVRSNIQCLKQNIIALQGLGNTGHSSDLKCKFCKMLFLEQGKLEKHLRTVHFMLKKYVCEVCNKCCSTKSNLQTHLRIHTGEKPYVCKVCNKRFRHYSGLRYHKNTHSAGTLFFV